MLLPVANVLYTAGAYLCTCAVLRKDAKSYLLTHASIAGVEVAFVW